jgi:hypothetical protein
MKTEVLDLYSELLEYCQENKLMIAKFDLKNNVFQELEIVIWDYIEKQQYYISLPEQEEIHYSFVDNENKHGYALQEIIDKYIY